MQINRFLNSLCVTDYFWNPAFPTLPFSVLYAKQHSAFMHCSKMSLVRIEPIIASAAVTTSETTREPPYGSGKTMTVQVHGFGDVTGEKNTAYRKYRQTFLFEARTWMFPLLLQVSETMNSWEP